MPKVAINRLQHGDIVLFQWTNDFWHTAVYYNDGQHQGIAHCANEQQGTLIEKVEGDHGKAKNVYAFRIPTARANALQTIMGLVRGWAIPRDGNQTVGYGTARGSGVVKEYDKNNPGNRPSFEFDALFRVFKWLDGRDKFSRNRGTTCCAFVTACFQSGLMRQYLVQHDLDGYIGPVRHRLDDERAGKRKPVRTVAEGIFRDDLRAKGQMQAAKRVPFTELDEAKIKARKQFTNPGSKNSTYNAPGGVDALWADILLNTCYSDRTETLQDVLTGPLLCDAKFTYSHTLYERLRADNSWTQVQ